MITTAVARFQRHRVLGEALLIALVAATLPASVATAGPCPLAVHTYCAAGLSNGVTSWTWKLDGVSGGCGPVVPPGAPTSALVSAMVACLPPATTPAVSTPNTCFTALSCTALVIDGKPVTSPVKFNPVIAEVLPEPSWLGTLVSGALAIEGLRRLRRRAARPS